METKRIKSKTGVMIKRKLSDIEREEARKRLFKVLDRIYENYEKNNSKHFS